MAQKADTESFQEGNVVGELSEAISLWMPFLFESHTIISDGCSDLLIIQGESLSRRESQLGERWLEWEAENNPGFQLKGVSGTRFRVKPGKRKE